MRNTKPMHGTAKALGCEHLSLGRFCRLFPDLTSWAEDCGVTGLCEAEHIAAVLGGAGGAMHDVDSESKDSDLPAAYTFLAQFIDHDVTLDTRSPLHHQPLDDKRFNELSNLRSASLDLDCVYGFGPEANPFLYDQSQHGRLNVGNSVNADDLPRNEQGRAFIGDPRNDENILVAQLQLLFLKFHNLRLVGRTFEDAQNDVRFHYQAMVLHDFLERVCDRKVYAFALKHILKKKLPGNSPTPMLDKCGRLCMPVEFSVAAYRFGHTMVRSQYAVNESYPAVEIFDERFGTLGFGPVPPELTVDWRFLLDVEPCHPYVKSKAFDHLLADELVRLPAPVVGRNAATNDQSLAFRNLLRGYVLGLPSGQKVREAVAALGYPVEPPELDLKLSELRGFDCLDKKLRDKLACHTPLFLYLMREAGLSGGKRLGPVGSAIVLHVFGAMLVHCKSFLHDKEWKVDPCVARCDGQGLTLADFVRYVASAQG